MQKKIGKEELFLIFLYFWLTILLIRSFVFFFKKEFFINYFLIGFLFILISCLIYFLPKGKSMFFPLFFCGLGLALFFDQFTFWFKKDFNYWAIENFLAIAFSFFIFLILFVFLKEKTKLTEISFKKTFHQNPKNPSISVVIPAFNEEKFLAKTLKTVLNQNYQDFELIVVDNNSTDKTSKVAQSFGARVIFEPRQGVAFARQKGFSEAKAEIIASTDADAILPPDWLSKICRAFEKDQKIVALGGLANLYSGPILIRSLSCYFLYPFLVLDRFFSGGWNLIGFNFALRKKAFLKIGGFNTELILNEDIEISDLLRKIGKVAFDKNLVIQVSGRRYKDGLINGLMTYIPSTVARLFLKKYDKCMKLPTVRIEASSTNNLLFLEIILSLLFLYFLFYFS